MRTTLFRWLSALVTALWLLAVGLAIRADDWRGFFTWEVFLSSLLIMPAIAVFAIGGPRAGNWVLVRGLKVMALPESLFQKIVMRNVEVPPELQEREREPQLKKSKEQ